MKLSASCILMAFVLLVAGCSEPSSLSRAPTTRPDGGSAGAVLTVESSGTLHGRIVRGGSRGPGPAGVTGSFCVSPALEDSRLPSPQRVFVTVDTTSTISLDALINPRGDGGGSLLFIDYHRSGTRIVADRVYAPLGLSY